MPRPEVVEKKSLAWMHKTIDEAKRRDSYSDTQVLDYMVEVAEKVAAKAREHRGQSIGVSYSDFAVQLALLVGKVAKEWGA